MNYILIYENIINRGLIRIKTKNDGLHKHRIIPGFEDGKYVKENICLLTRKEHRIIHKIRYKIYGKWQDLSAYAKLGGKTCSPWNKGKITGQIPWNKNKNTSFLGKTYEEIYGVESAEKLKDVRRQQILNNNHLQTENVKNKRTKSIISYYENNESKLKNKIKTEDHKKKISESMKNKTLKERFDISEEEYVELKKDMARRAMGNKSNTGKKWYNNGEINKVFFPNKVPNDSWKPGRIMKSTKGI